MVARDAADRPLAGLTALAVFERPTGRAARSHRADRALRRALSRARRRARAMGIVIDLYRGDKQLFRSQNRFVLH